MALALSAACGDGWAQVSERALLEERVREGLASTELAAVVSACITVGDEGLSSYGDEMLAQLLSPPQGPMDERLAVADAAFDALIRLRYPVPAKTLSGLASGHHRPPALILAVQDVDRHRELIRSFLADDVDDDLWTAASNILVAERDASAIATLLPRVQLRLEIVARGVQGTKSDGPNVIGYGGKYGRARISGSDFPRIPVYRVVTGRPNGYELLVDGPTPSSISRTWRRLDMAPSDVNSVNPADRAQRALDHLNALAHAATAGAAPTMNPHDTRVVPLLSGGYGAEVAPILVESGARWTQWADALRAAVPTLRREQIPSVAVTIREVGRARATREEIERDNRVLQEALDHLERSQRLRGGAR